MRLDRFLKVSRLLKRRSLAKEACDWRVVRVNGREAKAGKQLKKGDILELDLANLYLKVKVFHIPEGAVKRKEASLLYEVLEERRKDWGGRLLE